MRNNLFRERYISFIPLGKMKLQILSDLHLEFVHCKIEKTNADVIILAGDIHIGKRGLNWARENFLKQEVIYVLGNHEFYNEATPKLIEKLKAQSEKTNIHLLENESIVINGVRFLGCTLWTDFNLFENFEDAMNTAKLYMTDYKRIRISPQYNKIQPSYTAVLHNRSKLWLQKEMESCKEDKTVIISHHAPSIKSIPENDRNDPLIAAYASDMDTFVSWSNAKLWIHGHIHKASDYSIGQTRVVCNPRGYPNENINNFNPILILEI